jgi:glycosyltransferase involved in cell wall biosynthesis
MNIAIIVPAFNESENLFKLTKLIKKCINAAIIIGDDSIHDKTETVIINKKIQNFCI